MVPEHAAGAELLPEAAQVLARTGVRSWSPRCQPQRAGAEPGAAGQPRWDLCNTPNMKEGCASSLGAGSALPQVLFVKSLLGAGVKSQRGVLRQEDSAPSVVVVVLL